MGASPRRAAYQADRLIGAVLDGRYRIDWPIGVGGMGTVYRGVQLSVGRDVAIKVINADKARDPSLVRRFLREAKLSSRLLHPNAVSVFDFGQTEDGVYYLVMELLSGRTLEQILRAEGRLPPARVVHIGGQICRALMGAHHLQILHRDLKPANIMVLDGDHVKVVDFGIAKSLAPDVSTITGAGAFVGTPSYMAPELLFDATGDHRADLYSLGVVLFELAAGQRPFDAEDVFTLIEQVSSGRLPSLEQAGVPAPLAQVIRDLMAMNPDQRHPDASNALAALEAAARGGHPTLLAPTVLEQTSSQSLIRRARSPRRWPFALACVTALGVCGAAIWLALATQTPAQAPAPAPTVASPR